jgi:lactoylglutathione lyase
MFLWASAHVSKFDESVAFFTKILNLEIDRILETPNGRIVFFIKEGTRLELIEDAQNNTHVGYSIGFSCENLDKKIEYLKDNGYSKIIGPISPNPNVSFFFVEEPSGIKVQFVQSK